MNKLTLINYTFNYYISMHLKIITSLLPSISIIYDRIEEYKVNNNIITVTSDNDIKNISKLIEKELIELMFYSNSVFNKHVSYNCIMKQDLNLCVNAVIANAIEYYFNTLIN